MNINQAIEALQRLKSQVAFGGKTPVRFPDGSKPEFVFTDAKELSNEKFTVPIVQIRLKR